MSPSVCPRPAQPFRGRSSACMSLVTFAEVNALSHTMELQQQKTLHRQPMLCPRFAYDQVVCQQTSAAHYCITL